ncbi:LuxR C-terminal-related transcriptional regulator [Methylobacterium brachiatum]
MSTPSTPAAPRIAILADDDAFFRLALSTILKSRLGFAEVHETASLDEALERLAETPGVTMALFDLAMPGMAGAASLSAVCECFPDVMTVVVSGSNRRQDVLSALAAGVHGFVPKAAGVNDVAQALGMIVDGWVYVPSFITMLPRDETVIVQTSAATHVAAPPSVPAIVLTPRQRQVLGMLVDGRSNKEIARILLLSEGTVKIHVAALLKVLDVPNRSAAAVHGARFPGLHNPVATAS